MITVNTPYFQVQAIRRKYRDMGILTTAKPFTYVLLVQFANEGSAPINQIARDTLQIDADSDFIWCRTGWYAQDVRFNPPQSVSATSEDSTWETSRMSLFRFNWRILDSQRAFHQARFIDGVLFGGWSGVQSFNAGLSQDDVNREDVTPDAARDTGIGYYAHPFLEPPILPAQANVEVQIQSRANNNNSDHLIVFHGVRLFRFH